jgi:hypothetical protein
MAAKSDKFTAMALWPMALALVCNGKCTPATSVSVVIAIFLALWWTDHCAIITYTYLYILATDRLIGEILFDQIKLFHKLSV